MPCTSAAVAQVAVRALPEPVSATAEQPLMLTPPSRKATLPVGRDAGDGGGEGDDWPTVDGLSELASVVVVGAGGALTTCDSVVLVDVALVALPA